MAQAIAHQGSGIILLFLIYISTVYREWVVEVELAMIVMS